MPVFWRWPQLNSDGLSWICPWSVWNSRTSCLFPLCAGNKCEITTCMCVAPCLGLDTHVDWFTQGQDNLSPIASLRVSEQISNNAAVHSNMFCASGAHNRRLLKASVLLRHKRH